MRYVAVRNSLGNYIGMWQVDTTVAHQLNIVITPENEMYHRYTIAQGDTFESTHTRAVTAFAPHTFFEMELPPGVVYPRIGRPTTANANPTSRYKPWAGPVDDQLYGCPANYNSEFAVAAGQVANLVRQLQDICQVVHPMGANLSAFGHETRNLLVLACTEVEAQWQAILAANGYQGSGSRLNTNDFVKLLLPMRLADYSAQSAQFPWMAAERPFAGWTPSRPTASLLWYDAYNSVKHDREANFARATLGHAFAAVAACHILLVAQGASPIVYQAPELKFFHLERPAFALEQRYHERLVNGAASWSDTNYPL